MKQTDRQTGSRNQSEVTVVTLTFSSKMLYGRGRSTVHCRSIISSMSRLGSRAGGGPSPAWAQSPRPPRSSAGKVQEKGERTKNQGELLICSTTVSFTSTEPQKPQKALFQKRLRNTGRRFLHLELVSYSDFSPKM